MNDFKKIFSYAFKPKKYIIIAFILVIVETTFELLIPFVMSSLIDDGVKVKNMSHIYLTGLIIFFCALVSLITGFLYSRFSAKAAANFGKNLREAQFKKIESYSFDNLDHFESSSLVTRVINDSTILQNTLTTILRPLSRAPIMLILGIVLSFIINWTLAVIFLILTPILAVIMFVIFKIVSPKFPKLQRSLDHVNLVIEESLIAIKTIKAFVKEQYQEEKFSTVNQEYTSIVEKTFRIINIGTPLAQFMIYFSTILIMWFGGNLLMNSIIEEGDLTGIFSYVMQTFNAIMMLSNILISIARSLASLKRINEVLIEIPTIKDGGDINKKISLGNIEFKNVYFKYSSFAEEYVLNNISFNLNQGEILGIIGGTGSGKSSLAELLLRLYDIDKGEILIDNQNIKNYTLDHLRENIAIVLQKNYLFSGTLKDNLLWGNINASDEEINKVIKISCVDEFIDKLPKGIHSEMGVNGNNVSGGQKQRICIARALLKHPKILILDDSTSALDTITERKLIDNLKKENITIIIITQRIVSLALANKVLVLDNGYLSGYGSKEKLLRENKIYQDFYYLQHQEVKNG